MLQLSHELNKQLGAAVGIDTYRETLVSMTSGRPFCHRGTIPCIRPLMPPTKPLSDGGTPPCVITVGQLPSGF